MSTTDNQPDLEDYEKAYSDESFWDKLRLFARKAGIKVVYAALLLFYAYKRKDTPAWAKNVVFGVLGYFLSPIDFIPDLTPIVGYTDDLGILSFGLVTIAAYINKDVKEKARAQLGKWFGEYRDDELADVDAKL